MVLDKKVVTEEVKAEKEFQKSLVPSKQEAIDERRERAMLMREQSKSALIESKDRVSFENKMARDEVRNQLDEGLHYYLEQ